MAIDKQLFRDARFNLGNTISPAEVWCLNLILVVSVTDFVDLSNEYKLYLSFCLQ